MGAAGVEPVRARVSGFPETFDLCPDDVVTARRRTRMYLQKRAERPDFPVEQLRARELQVGDWFGIPKRRHLPRTSLSDEQLYALGFWLAEGHIVLGWDRALRGIGLTNTDQETLRRVGASLRKWFPRDYVKRGNDRRIWQEERPATEHLVVRPVLRRGARFPICDYVLYSRDAAEFFYEQCGHSSDTKRIPETIYNSSGILSLVAAVIDGDGTQRSDGQRDVTIYSTSAIMARQIQQVLIDAGIWATRQRIQRSPYVLPISGKTASAFKVMWKVNIKASYLHLLPPCKIVVPEVRHLRHVMEDDDFFYSPIRAIGDQTVSPWSVTASTRTTVH